LVHYLLPYRKKDQFKAYGVKWDLPGMEMVHHQDVTVELSTRLLTAQHEIKTLCICNTLIFPKENNIL
jgi:hypothetical protein